MLVEVFTVKLEATGPPLDKSEKLAVKKIASMVLDMGISLLHSVLISNVRVCLNNLSFRSSDSDGAPIERGLTMIPTSCSVSK